jgi:poly(3-hydroxybutyrate) depolymerase
MTSRDPHWTTAYRVVHQDPALRLLQFRGGPGQALLLVPPQAGHHSYIADFAPGQSLVESALAHTRGPVYAIEWQSCSFERRREGIIDLVNQLGTAVKAVAGPVHLVGLCQGGWLSALYGALHPGHLASLTIAGAPIDTHAGDSVLHPITALPLAVFQGLVAMGGGRMSGDLMLAGWKAGDPVQHYLARHFKDDEKTERFYRWYDLVQHLPGTLYLWIIEHLFQRNALGRNRLVVGDQRVDLGRLAEVPVVQILTGANDDITPPEQSHALLRHTDARCYQVDAGHIGVFMGRRAIQGTWSKAFRALNRAVSNERKTVLS